MCTLSRYSAATAKTDFITSQRTISSRSRAVSLAFLSLFLLLAFQVSVVCHSSFIGSKEGEQSIERLKIGNKDQSDDLLHKFDQIQALQKAKLNEIWLASMVAVCQRITIFDV